MTGVQSSAEARCTSGLNCPASTRRRSGARRTLVDGYRTAREQTSLTFRPAPPSTGQVGADAPRETASDTQTGVPREPSPATTRDPHRCPDRTAAPRRPAATLQTDLLRPWSRTPSRPCFSTPTASNSPSHRIRRNVSSSSESELDDATSSARSALEEARARRGRPGRGRLRALRPHLETIRTETAAVLEVVREEVLAVEQWEVVEAFVDSRRPPGRPQALRRRGR